MAVNCKYCGAGLLDNQRFCRQCGKPTDQYPEDNVPTQVMQPDTDSRSRWGQANTAEPLRADTSPVYNPQPVSYRPPAYQPPAPPYPPSRSRSPWGWIVAFMGMGLIGVIIVAMFLFAARSSRRTSGPPPIREVEARAGETIFRGEEPVAFTLGSEAKVSIQNIRGDIRIEGWDGSQAEVKVIRRGGSSRSRESAEVIYSEEGGNLALRTAPTRGNSVDVDYEIKLPRRLGRIEIESVSSDVKISDVNAAISIKTQRGSIELSDIKGDITADNQSGSIRLSDIVGEISANSKSGDIELSDVSGTASGNSISGDIKVEFQTVAEGKGLKFNTVSGDIELQFQTPVNADLRAKTVSGRIDLDEEFGLRAEKEMVGQRAEGIIGKGGTPLSITTISGKIRITK